MGRRASIKEYELLETMSPQERIAYWNGDDKPRTANPRLLMIRARRREWEKENRVVGVCPTCGDEALLTMDHVIPRSKGGSNRRSNIQWVCEPCNSDKADSLDWQAPIDRLDSRRRVPVE